MDFTPQMRAVLQAIWTLRARSEESGQYRGRPLKHTKVESLACEILSNGASEGEKPKVVSRQSWYNQNGKDEWIAINRAINGKPPLNQQTDVEIAIAEFGKTDPAKEIIKELLTLKDKVVGQKKIIEGHRAEFEEFRAKAYAQQYMASDFADSLDSHQKQVESAQVNLKREEDLRKKYQAEATKLRRENNELTKYVKKRGGTSNTEIRHLTKKFSPDLSELKPEVADKDLLLKYSNLRNQSWDGMMKATQVKAPDDIYLIFHKFNIMLDDFIEKNLPLNPGGLTYIFACYQPYGRRREEMYKEAAKLLTVAPVVVIVDNTIASKVLPLPNQRDITQRLHDKQAKSKFEHYDPIAESYEQVWIERIKNG